MSYRKQIIIAGREASGKTYWAEQYARRFPGLAIIYNRANPNDFKGCRTLRFVGARATTAGMDKKKRSQYLSDPHAVWLETEAGQRLPFAAIAKLKGLVEILPISSRRDQDLFFKGLSDWAANALVILDDSRVILRYGVTEGLGNMLLTKRHSGRKLPAKAGRGMDVVIMTHSVDLVNPELVHSATHLVLFATTKSPNVARFKNDDLEAAILSAHGKVSSAGLYSWAQIPLRGNGAYSVTLNRPI